MAKLKIDVNIIDSEKIKTLIELLYLYKDDLPEKLKESLIDIADNEAFEYDADDWRGNFKCVADGADITNNYAITSVNRILKRITYYPTQDNGSLIRLDGMAVKRFIHPDHAEFYIDNDLILEW